MKKLVFVVAALAALSLLAPSSGFAQTAHNQIGLYFDTDYTINNADGVAAFGQATAYLVVTNPYDYTLDQPVASIGGYELGLTYPSTALVLGLTFNGNGLNVGDNEDQIVGFGTGVQVIDNACLLATMTLLLNDPLAQPANIMARPTEPASIPGHLAFLHYGAEQPLIEAYPASGSFDDPIFSINGAAVATEATSFENIKAMYR